MSVPVKNRRVVDVTAIVVTYNRDAALQQTLEGLLQQDPAPKEILVIDQSQQHDERTSNFLKRITDTHQIRYVFQQEPNAQQARNRAIMEARGDILLFVDDDVVMDETLVGSHWKNYSDPQLGAVCGYYTEPGSTATDEMPWDCEDELMGWLYFPHAYNKRVECYSLPTCNGSIRKHLAIQLGGFDENYRYTLLDDTDFSCRFKDLGIKAIHDPEARLTHLKEPAGGQRPGSLNEFVIADSNRWYTWVYFFWMNFRWRGGREIFRRLRRTVFRRKNIVRPWYLALAFWHFVKGAMRAAKAIRGGRRLGLASPLALDQPTLLNSEMTRTALAK
jgi:GT2 family glycosyltransferase